MGPRAALWMVVWWAGLRAAASAAEGDEGRHAWEKVARRLNDPDVEEAARFAVGELRKLSDSGIYKTLRLVSIREAASNVGVYHENMFLKVDLASPFFKSRRESETFDIMVMKHLSEDATSFAIDEFPVMEEGAIERFWTEMVEERRAKRRSLFDSLLRQRAR